MTVPKYDEITLPLLRLLSDGKEHRFRDAVEALAAEFKLSDADQVETLPSGQLLFSNRVGWASTYIKKAGLVIAPRMGHFRISDRGLSVLSSPPPKIDWRFLDQFAEFRAFRNQRRASSSSTEEEGLIKPAQPEAVQIDDTPQDALARAYRQLRRDLELELLEQVKASSPTFFEHLVIDLLVAMGYGGSIQDAGRAIGRSGDGGIDGVIKEDRLGLDAIYVQAKRWDGTVGRPDIQRFAGALQGQHANKGVFITTSNYSREAIEYAKTINTKIVLIDGEELTRLMVDHDVGVSTTGRYELKKIDSDYFEGA